MKRLVPALVLVLAISLPTVAMARPAAPPAVSRPPAVSVIHRVWSTLLWIVRSPARLILPEDDGGGHTLPPPGGAPVSGG